MNRFEVLGNLGSGELTFHHVSEIQLCTPIGVYVCVCVCVCVCLNECLCVCVLSELLPLHFYQRIALCCIFTPPGVYLDILKYELGRKVKLFRSANKKKEKKKKKKHFKTGIKWSRHAKPENVS